MAGICILVMLLLCGCGGAKLSKWTLVHVLLLNAVLLASSQGMAFLIYHGER